MMLLPLLVLGMEVSGVVASASAAASQTRRLLSRSVRRVRLGGVDCTMPDDDPPACSESSSVGEVCTSLAKDLKPTQSSLGFVLKQCKTAKYNGKKASKMAKYLAEDSHLVPAVLGPNGGIYITDHHHLSRGLYESDYADVPENICITRDLSNLNSTLAFWNAMNATHSVWTFDHKGVAYATMEEVVKAIPATIAGSFDDDPFRSLSEYIRDKDGYIKCKPDTPTADFPQCKKQGDAPFFLEFVWANYLRTRAGIAASIYTTKPDDQITPLIHSFTASMKAAQSDAAKGLPGWNEDPANQTADIDVDPDSGCEQ